MRQFTLAIIFALLFLTGCGSGTSDTPEASASAPALSTLPATVEGFFTVDVEEGDVAEDGVSDFNAGTLTVGEDELLVEVSGDVLRSAGLPAEGGKVRATLSSKSEQFGVPMYKVSALQRL